MTHCPHTVECWVAMQVVKQEETELLPNQPADEGVEDTPAVPQEDLGQLPYQPSPGEIAGTATIRHEHITPPGHNSETTASTSEVEIRQLCTHCDMKFWTRKDLLIHYRSHTAERPYLCYSCGNRYKEKCNLLKHLNIHTQRPFKCQYCSSTFAHQDSLGKHLRTHKPRSYWCDMCDRGFLTNQRLGIHRRTHTGEKPYRCQLCPMAVVNAENLKRHMMRTHEGVKPYQCNKCEEAFRDRSELRAHKNEKHGH